MTRAVVISGSRSTDHHTRQEYDALFAEFLAPFVPDDTVVYVGGAKGIDSLALAWLVDHTGARVVVAVPGTVSTQPEEAQATITAAQQQGGTRVDVVELRHEEFPSAASYHSRNRWMVDRAGLLVAFPCGDNPTSGTWYTADYAAERGLPRLIVPI
jgi:predicted Rossmann fold nucleotide-binding protein DprA/Smf involved in DNA uptake